MASTSPVPSSPKALPDNCALEVCMVCAEPIEPASKDLGGPCFWRGCNHSYHQDCLKIARSQGIEDCPRCAELAEADVWFPSVAESELRATQLEEQLQEEAEEEERLQDRKEDEREGAPGDDEGSATEVSMGEDSEVEVVHVGPAAIFGAPKAGTVHVDEADTQPAIIGAPEPDEDEKPLLPPSQELEDAQPLPPALPAPPAQQPTQPQQPQPPKGRKTRAPRSPKGKRAPRSKAAARAARSDAAASSPQAAARSQAAEAPPRTVAPRAAGPSDALVEVEAPETALVDSSQLVQCWLCLTAFKSTSENAKKKDAKQKCKGCCKVDTVSSLSLI